MRTCSSSGLDREANPFGKPVGKPPVFHVIVEHPSQSVRRERSGPKQFGQDLGRGLFLPSGGSGSIRRTESFEDFEIERRTDDLRGVGAERRNSRAVSEGRQVAAESHGNGAAIVRVTVFFRIVKTEPVIVGADFGDGFFRPDSPDMRFRPIPRLR